MQHQFEQFYKVYGQQESINEERDQCNVEVLFKRNVEEIRNEKIERLYGELREIEQGDLR
jgi:hypothetical protein